MSEKSAEEKQNSSTVKAETSVAAEKASAFRSYLEKEKITGVSFMMWETQFTRMSSAVIFLYRGRVCLL